MREKQLPLLLVALILMAVVAISACADQVTAGGAAVGDRYAVTTISGEAHAWVSGSWVVSTADLQLMVQVTHVGPNNIVFRVLSGTFQFNGGSTE